MYPKPRWIYEKERTVSIEFTNLKTIHMIKTYEIGESFVEIVEHDRRYINLLNFRGILVYNVCLIGIRASVFDKATKKLSS